MSLGEIVEESGLHSREHSFDLIFNGSLSEDLSP